MDIVEVAAWLYVAPWVCSAAVVLFLVAGAVVTSVLGGRR